MSNAELKRRRMEQYFIDAACEIICDNGISNATIRNIAEKAGYNSATLYSYFKSLSHLLAHASVKFEREMLVYIGNKIEKARFADVSVVWPEVYVAMADYLLDHPNIFECNFIAIYDGLTREEVIALRDKHSEFAHFVSENLGKIAALYRLDIRDAVKISDYCLSLMVGTVLLSTKQRTAYDKNSLLADLKVQIEYVINSNLRSIQNGEKR